MESESEQQIAAGDMVRYTGKSFSFPNGFVVKAGTVGKVESLAPSGVWTSARDEGTARVNVTWICEKSAAVDSHLLEPIEEPASSTTIKGGKRSRRKRTKKSRTTGGKKSRKQRKRKTRKCSKRKRRRTCRRR